MPGLLKNVLLTALMVIAATVMGAICAALAMLFTAPPEQMNAPNLGAGILMILVIVAVAMLFGMIFCIVTLFMAALTMPPVLALAQWLRLPRPAVDILGGALMGYVCGMMAAEMIDADKLAAMVTDAGTYSVAVVSVFFGGLLGFLHHLILVPRVGVSTQVQPAIRPA